MILVMISFGTDQATMQNSELVRAGFFTLIRNQNLLITLIALLFLYVLKEKPDIPPSSLATQEQKKREVIKEMISVFTNKNYLFMTLAFSFCYGGYTGFGNLLSQIFSPYGYSMIFQASSAASSILFGMIATGIASKYVDKTKNYLATFKI